MSFSHHSLQELFEKAEKLGYIMPYSDLVLTDEQKELLEHQSHTAKGFAEQCLWGIQNVGLLLATAEDSVDTHMVTNIGHLLSQLGEYAHTALQVSDNAEFLLHGDLSKGQKAPVD